MVMRDTNPKQYAYDIADGFVYITEANIRKFSPAELRELYRTIIRVEREIRGEVIPPDEHSEIKRRSMRLQRLYRTKTLIANWAKPRKIPL